MRSGRIMLMECGTVVVVLVSIFLCFCGGGAWSILLISSCEVDIVGLNFSKCATGFDLCGFCQNELR